MSKDKGEQLKEALNNPKHVKFCQEFVIDLDQCSAYKRAGYKVKSDAVARASASRLLTDVNIQAYIQYLRQQQQSRTGITADRVLEEYARIAFSQITDALSFDEGGVTLKASRALKPDVVAAIESVSSQQSEQGVKFTLKMHNKIAALDALAKHLGLHNDLNSAWRTLERYGFQRKETDRGYELIDTYQDGADAGEA